MAEYSWNRKYIKKITSGLLIIGGSFLLLEHLFSFQGFDLEIVGHEYYGIGMIVVGFVLSIKWEQLPAFLKALKNHNWRKILDKGKRK